MKEYFTSAFPLPEKKSNQIKNLKWQFIVDATTKSEAFCLGRLITQRCILFSEYKTKDRNIPESEKCFIRDLAEPHEGTYTQHVVMFLGHSLQAKDLQSSTLKYDAFK